MKGSTNKSEPSVAPVTTPRRIEPRDIEAKFNELRGEVDQTTEAAKGTIVAVGAALAVGVVLVAFVFGRKRGKKRTTIVEIRRV
ncbi:MAG TPA: hypothetical protein VHA73_08190 [Acidimicrobiales bacterium]|nr:hypothetical protein [Acidimicrobiales bacterium]